MWSHVVHYESGVKGGGGGEEEGGINEPSCRIFLLNVIHHFSCILQLILGAWSKSRYCFI